MKKTVTTGLAAVLMVLLALTGCSGRGEGSEESTKEAYQSSRQVTIGFSQVGSESDWRTANTKSMKETFCAANGYNLLFDDAQQKQEKQITAIRNFIQQEVDYIILAPVTEEGWDTVLQEAKDAEIPVIVVDRMVNVSDDNLYTAWIGSDFRREGEKACSWLYQYTKAKGIRQKDLHIVNIQGTKGATSQLGRTGALKAAVKKYGWDLAASESGDYARTKGKEVMGAMLKAHPNLNVVYCENDNEAFGAIEALQQADKKIGTDLGAGEIMILSFDGTKEALKNVIKGKQALVTECEPLQGPYVRRIVEALEQGEHVAKRTYIEEKIFAADDTIPSVKVRSKSYDITIVTRDIIRKREY